MPRNYWPLTRTIRQNGKNKLDPSFFGKRKISCRQYIWKMFTQYFANPSLSHIDSVSPFTQNDMS